MLRSSKLQCKSGRLTAGSSRPRLGTPASAGHPSQFSTERDSWDGYGGVCARCGGDGWGECGVTIGIFGWKRNLEVGEPEVARGVENGGPSPGLRRRRDGAGLRRGTWFGLRSAPFPPDTGDRKWGLFLAAGPALCAGAYQQRLGCLLHKLLSPVPRALHRVGLSRMCIPCHPADRACG